MMSALSVDRWGSARMAARWWPNVPIRLQVTLAIAMAAGLLVVLNAVMPMGFAQARGSVLTLLHELAHACVGWLDTGIFGVIELHDDGGIAHVSSDSTLGRAVSAGAGLVVPAWVAAWALIAGLTRVGDDVLLLLVGVVILGVTHFHAHIPANQTVALTVVAVVMIAGGAMPIDHALRSGLVLTFAGAMCWEVVATAQYAFVEFIDGDPERPADGRILADALGLTFSPEIGRGLIGAMLAGPVVALLSAWALLSRQAERVRWFAKGKETQ